MNDIYKYKALFDTFPDGLIVLDSHGKIVLVNEKTETLFGYGKVGLIGKGIDILIPERFNKNIFEQLANFISTPRVIVKGTEKDFYVRKKDGTEFAIEITINLVQLESGNFVSIAISEITKLKKIELLLAEAQKKSFESQKLFSKIFHFSPVPIILSRVADGLLLDVNLAFLNLTGFTLDDLKERTVSDSGIFIESEKRKNVLTSIRKSYQLQNIETTIKTKFGKTLNGIATTSLVVINEEECVISSFADITERKEASLKVKSLSSIIENSLNEILIFDRESLKIVFANKKVLKNIGYSKREIEQLTVVDLKPEFTRELYFKKIDPLLSGEVELISFETIHRRKDGTIYSVEVQVQLSEYDGRKTFTGINLDITTHKKENIKTLQYSQAIEQNPASIVITDTSGNIEYVNPRFLETTGYSKGEVMGKNPRILKSGYTSSSDYANLWKQILSGNIWQGELQNVTKSGKLYWEQVIISPILNEKGKIINFIAIKENITKRIQIEQELRESERFLKETQLIANLGTYSLDFITDKWTSSMLLNNIFGIEADFDRSIKGWLSIIHPEWQKELFNYLRDEVIGKNKSFDKEYKIIRKDDNAERWVHGVGSLKFNHGKLLSMVGTIQDITERKNIELEFAMQNKRLNAQNEELEQFTYIASHDLQEPLHTLKSFTELLKEEFSGKLDKDAEQYLGFIIQSSTRMQKLVKGLLDFSRIGKEVNLVSVDCNEIINVAISDLSISIKECGAIITVEHLPKLKGYAVELRLLFQNLLSNAMKFREKGAVPEIKISAKKYGDRWIFSIMDNGIGIDKKNIDKIFIIFKRLHNRRDYEGTGIGLSHCKKIVELHGGEIWVDSELGKGSTFYFSILTL